VTWLLPRLLAAAAMALLLMLPAAAQDGVRKPRPLFASHEIIHITIEAPVDRLIRERAREGLRVPGQLLLKGHAPETLPIELALRGRTRRTAEVCPFPPLEVRFRSRPGEQSLFAGQGRMKLVTHCRPVAQFQQHVLLEYAAYRILNRLTPQSFSVRLAQIDYVGANGRPIISRYGFLIEHLDQVARRNRMQVVRVAGNIPESRFEPAAAARFAIFQELIGSLDWSMNGAPPGTTCCHNVRQIAPMGERQLLVPVPYDFDYAGLVDAPYAVPPDLVRVSSVRERRYRGFCRHNDEAVAYAAELAGRRTEVLAVLDEIGPLEDRVRSRAKAYLDSHFRELADKERTATRIAQRCLR
jgi:hypothetical protein